MVFSISHMRGRLGHLRVLKALALPFQLTGRPPVLSPDGAESGLPAGLDQGHVGVGEAKMVTDLVDQHVADDAVHWLAVSVGVTEDGDAVEKDPVGQTCRIQHAFERQSDAMIQPEQIIRIADMHRLERLRVGEIGHMNRHIAQNRPELLRQSVPDCLSGHLEIFVRPRLT